MKNPVFIGIIFALIVSFYSPVQTVALGFDIEKEVRVPVLMYHFLATDNNRPNPWKIRVEAFESDLIALRREGFRPVFMQELIDYVYGGAALPERPVVISFDDGAYDFYKHGFPLLKKHDMKAVMAIIGFATDKYSEDTEQNKYAVSNLKWEHVRELRDSGLVEIQSHSYDMHKGTGAAKNKGESLDSYRARFGKDAERFNEQILAQLGSLPTTFIFPFGNKSKESDDILREIGFLSSLTCEERISVIKKGEPDSLFGLGRILRAPSMSSEDLIAKIRDLEK